MKLSPLFVILTLSSFPDFSSGETNFYFCQFLFNFFKYLFSNFLLSQPYNIFTICFSGNSLLLKSSSPVISNFFCFLTSVFTLLSNSATTSFMFSKSSSLSQLLYSVVNLFHHTIYFTTPLTFLYLVFSLLFTFWLLLPLLVLLLPLSTLLPVSYIILLNWYS